MSDPLPNRQLEVLMAQFGFSSQQDLADAVNDATCEIFGERFPRKCTQRHVRNWLSGRVRWPWTRYLLALELIFGRPAEAIGFIPRGKNSTNLPAPPRRPAVPKEAHVLRRRFVTAGAAATVAAALGIEDTPTQGRLSMSDMHQIHERLGRLDAHFFSIGGGPLLDVATAYIDRLRSALNSCTYGERVERVLHGAVSSLYASAGWAARDIGDHGQAALLHAAGLQSALLTVDASAIARAWSDLAVQARSEGRHREAVQKSRAARAVLDNRRARQDPHLAALLHARLAIAQAHTGDRTGTARSLLAAEQAYDRITPGPPPASWLNFLSAAEVSGLAAIAHRALGRYAEAEAATAQALTLLPPSMRRQHILYGVQLAELQLAQGEREQAAHTITRLDAASLDSSRITGRLATVQRALTTD
ncbi:hypothetical protein [Streptomyces sp. NPDC052114]|uniref:hypothetical protein n=1 Tax=unclassified Streptomyces TaxID=2593676 RepID=UPI00341759C7